MSHNLLNFVQAFRMHAHMNIIDIKQIYDRQIVIIQTDPNKNLPRAVTTASRRPCFLICKTTLGVLFYVSKVF